MRHLWLALISAGCFTLFVLVFCLCCTHCEKKISLGFAAMLVSSLATVASYNIDFTYYNFQSVSNKGADQTVWIGRLVCIFVVLIEQGQVFSRRDSNKRRYNKTWPRVSECAQLN